MPNRTYESVIRNPFIVLLFPNKPLSLISLNTIFDYEKLFTFMFGNTAIDMPLALPFVYGSVVLFICWRLWRFTIRPLFYPQEPKELPYWIPCKRSPNLQNRLE